ncbi:hypothetical protein PMAYCL1PPCAC_28564, partial [Pristionchus mayeri]
PPMRLLSLTLLLLSFSPSLSAPTEQKTTIETVVESVTRTVIHDVTDPSDEMEGSGTEEEAVTGESGVAVNVIAPETRKTCPCTPCKCKPKTNSDSETLTSSDIKGISGSTKMCTCEVSTECRKGAIDEMDTCMNECSSEIKEYGDKTEDYLKCFSKNNETIVEAEECLFANYTDFCVNDKDAKFANKTNWDDLTNVNYTSEVSKEIKENSLWKRDESKYNTMQNFFHCTKNCIHKKFQKCTAEKGCTVGMPAPKEFATKMNGCIKKNPKIATSILKACQCLAWHNGVTALRGSCVVIGNQYFIDRA